MKSASFLLAGTLGLCMALQIQARTVFFDDFGDQPAEFTDDGEPVNWGTGATGRKDRGGGNLVVTVLPGSPYASAFVPLDPYEDVSVRTQFRMDDTGIDRAGVTARNSGASVTFYYGSLTPTGTLEMWRVTSGQSTLLDETELPGIDPITHDVNMQLDAFGELLSLTAWAAGSLEPDGPQISLEDSAIANGRSVGVWMGGGTGTSTTYRYFTAIPEPGAASLLLAGFAGLMALRQGTRALKGRTFADPYLRIPQPAGR